MKELSDWYGRFKPSESKNGKPRPRNHRRLAFERPAAQSETTMFIGFFRIYSGQDGSKVEFRPKASYFAWGQWGEGRVCANLLLGVDVGMIISASKSSYIFDTDATV